MPEWVPWWLPVVTALYAAWFFYWVLKTPRGV